MSLFFEFGRQIPDCGFTAVAVGDFLLRKKCCRVLQKGNKKYTIVLPSEMLELYILKKERNGYLGKACKAYHSETCL